MIRLNKWFNHQQFDQTKNSIAWLLKGQYQFSIYNEVIKMKELLSTPLGLLVVFCQPYILDHSIMDVFCG